MLSMSVRACKHVCAPLRGAGAGAGAGEGDTSSKRVTEAVARAGGFCRPVTPARQAMQGTHVHLRTSDTALAPPMQSMSQCLQLRR